MMNAAPKWNRVSDAEMVRRLERPAGKIHVILDTDTYNEIDDQFALSYMVRSVEKLEVKAITPQAPRTAWRGATRKS